LSSYDVLIAGAGPAGAVAAALLARSGRRTLLVDRFDDDDHKVGECLPGPAVQLLRRLGLPSPDEDGPHERIAGVRSFWGDEVSRQDGFNDPGGGAWRLDRRRFDHDLRTTAVDHGVSLLQDFIEDASHGTSGWRLTTATGAVLHAATVVDATGRRARIARRIGARQQADETVVAVWGVGERCTDKHSTQTLIETGGDGWWYGAFLPMGEPIAVYHCAPSMAASLSRNPHSWRDLLAETRLLAKALPVALFRSLALRCSDARGLVLDAACGNGWFACGDAAISFNPLSSQGLFNSLATAAMVAKSVLEHDQAAARAHYQTHIDRVRGTYRAHMKELERRRNTIATEAEL